MRYFYLALLILLLVLTASCTDENEEAISQREIRDLMYDLASDFNLGNVYGMLDKVHNDYLHKGQITWHLNQEILDRRARFQLLEIEVIYIEFQSDRYAVVHSRDHYKSSIENVTFGEPEASGIFSYLKREKGQWLIYGNQLWY